MGLLIEDGLTLDGVIPARGKWPELKFRYRPALPEQGFAYAKAKQETGKQLLAATIDLLSKHLVSWDVTDAQDELVPITPAALAKVPQRYLTEMVNFVTGYEDHEADVKN